MFVLAAGLVLAGTNEVIVSATRVTEPASAVPASVSVISGDQLRTGAPVNADELLRTLSGISVLRNYGIGSGIPGQINVRGVPGLHGLLMLADGYRLNEAGTGFLSPNEIPVAAIERLEAVRGPFSALYGADAFSGVVNMVLREPGTGKWLTAMAGAGNDGFLDISASVSGLAGDYAYFAALQQVEMDNVLARDRIIESIWNPQAGAYMELEKEAENFDYRDRRMVVKTASRAGDNGKLALQARYFDSSLGMGMEDMRPLYPVEVESDSETRSIFAGVEYTHILSEGAELKARVSYRDQQREVWGLDVAGFAGAIPLFSESYSKTDSDESEIGLEFNMERSADHMITMGVDARQTGADFGGLKEAVSGTQFAASLPDSASVENYGLFVQDSYRAGFVRIVSGIRIDSHSDFGGAYSPKLGFLWDASDIVILRLAGGRAFRAPSLLELHQPDVGYGSVTFMSNPDLDPEYVNSVDAGFTISPSDNVSLDVTLFYNDMEDLIGPQIDGQIYSFRNISEAWSRGIEMELNSRLVGGLGLHLAATLQETRDTTAHTDLQHIPAEIFGAGLRYSGDAGICEVQASLDGVYSSSRQYADTSTGMWLELDSYFRADASLDLIFHRVYKIGVSAMNLFDEDYQESPVINPAPGRVVAVRAGVEW